MLAEPFRLSTGPQVMEKLWPRRDSCLFQHFLKCSPDILILRSPASDYRLTHRAVDAGLHTIVKALQKWSEFREDWADSKPTIVVMFSFVGANRQSPGFKVNILPRQPDRLTGNSKPPVSAVAASCFRS
jgi:hypothetical protein